jgi:hypothetical protein
MVVFINMNIAISQEELHSSKTRDDQCFGPKFCKTSAAIGKRIVGVKYTLTVCVRRNDGCLPRKRLERTARRGIHGYMRFVFHCVFPKHTAFGLATS